MRWLSLLLLLVVASPTAALADTKDDEAVAKFLKKLTKSKYLTIQGRVFSDFSVDLSKGDKTKETAFEVTRAYLTLKSEIVKWLRVRVTADFARWLQSDEESPLLGFIKYAYFDLRPVKGLSIKFGQHDTPWIETFQHIFEYRFVHKTHQDHFKTMSSAELGVSLNGDFFQKRLQFTVGIFNGTGYKNPAGKRPFEELLFLGMLSYYPLAHTKGFAKKFGIHAFFSHNQNKDDAGKVVRTMLYGGGLSLKSKHFTIAGEAMVRQDNAGGKTNRDYIVGGYLEGAYKGWALFGQVGANIAPDRDGNSTNLKLVAGVSYEPIRPFKIALDYQQDWHAKFKDTISHKVFVHTAVFW